MLSILATAFHSKASFTASWNALHVFIGCYNFSMADVMMYSSSTTELPAAAAVVVTSNVAGS
jgi:hypothetical protein